MRSRRQGLSEIISMEIKDPRVSEMTSVTHVDLTRDLKYAKVYISVFDDEKKKKSTIETLTHAEHFIKNEVGNRCSSTHMAIKMARKISSMRLLRCKILATPLW